ncbi:MAG: hypothetical protein JSW07_19125 [bacterium]|nr:MAG: hypothetical protein JSW07_19125 [bacterium]
MASYNDVKKAKAQSVKSLKKKLNVNGVAVGHKIVNGKDTGEPCVTILVRKKLAKSELLSKDLVPQAINGIPTDVKEVGEIVAFQARTDHWRPAPGGVSIGHYLMTAGTLGAFVKDATTGETLILSNNHVMANSNRAAKGDAIVQPGAADGASYPDDRIAVLERFIPIQFPGSGNGGDDGDDGGNGGGCSIAYSTSGALNFVAKILGSGHRLVPVKISTAVNEVDAAVAKPVNRSVIRGDIVDIGVISGTKPAAINMAVRKSGRTTGTTSGIIEMLDVTVDVGYGSSRTATFENQIMANAMSSPGDSGSLVVDGTAPLAVGLLFAGSDVSTVINPIDRVLDLLDIRF